MCQMLYWVYNSLDPCPHVYFWAKLMRLKHPHFDQFSVHFVKAYSGLCQLNGAIPCLRKEELASQASIESAQQAPGREGTFRHMNKCVPSDTCAMSSKGKEKQAMLTAKFIFPNPPMFNLRKIYLLCFMQSKFLHWQLVGHNGGLRLILVVVFLPAQTSWKIQCISSVFRHDNPQ